jgi:hypothetical protein
MTQRQWAIGMGAATLAFVAWAFARTDELAALLESDVATARAMAVRDLGSGITLLASKEPRPALVARALYDLGDAAVFGRSRPKVAASALGFAALGLAGLRLR